jgi:hypothetical protein
MPYSASGYPTSYLPFRIVPSSRLMRLRYGALDPPLLFAGQPFRFTAFEDTGHEAVALRAGEGENVA